MRWITGVTVLLLAVLIYGYWHQLTHGSVNISLYDASAEKSFQLMKTASVILLDARGKVLASGQSDPRFGVVYLNHPEIGSCYEAEHDAPFSVQGRQAWKQCFARHSTWIMEWIREVRQITIKHPRCILERVPVEVTEFSDDWWLWWIPHPHVGGKPYTYFRINMEIDPVNCQVI